MTAGLQGRLLRSGLSAMVLEALAPLPGVQESLHVVLPVVGSLLPWPTAGYHLSTLRVDRLRRFCIPNPQGWQPVAGASFRAGEGTPLKPSRSRPSPTGIPPEKPAYGVRAR